MRVSEQVARASGTAEECSVTDGSSDWADQTRRVLTRDLLVRARHAQPGERAALEFRALHLNLPLALDVTDRLVLTDTQRRRVEHHALDGLHEAVRRYDPYGGPDFAEFAVPLVERQVRSHVPPVSLVVGAPPLNSRRAEPAPR